MFSRVCKLYTIWMKYHRLVFILCIATLIWLSIIASHSQNSTIINQRDLGGMSNVFVKDMKEQLWKKSLLDICNSSYGNTVVQTLKQLISVMNYTHNSNVSIDVIVQESPSKLSHSHDNDHQNTSRQARKEISHQKDPSATATSRNVSMFKTLLTFEEKDILEDIAIKLIQVATLNNVTCFMYGGTLLGSYRHHDIIPWDDDIDVLVNLSSRDVLYYALKELYPRFGVFSAGPRLKFFHANSMRKSKYPWKWPYVDIHFYKENATHIWDSASEFSWLVYQKKIIFPLHPRPLGKLFIASPFDGLAIILATYSNVDYCETYFYSHKYEENYPGVSIHKIPCKSLREEVAFVHRSPAGKGIRETLFLGRSIIHTLVIDEPAYAITNPYSLDLI